MIDAILPKLLPGPAIFHKPLARILGFDAISRAYADLRGCGEIERRLIEKLAIAVRVSDSDLQRVPKTGSVIVVANHPTGILDGAALSAMLRRVRSDVKFLANDLLAGIPELCDRVLPVDMTGRNLRGLRQAADHLSGGGCLVIFPAGEVSHWQRHSRRVEDSAWATTAARLAERFGAATVPVYISAANTAIFHAAGAKLRTALLIRELLNKRNRTIEIRIGAPIDHARLQEIPTAEARTEYLRWRSYLLKERGGVKTQTSRSFIRPRARALAPIREAIDASILACEISALDPLVSSNGLAAYIATPAQIPETLQEIGRLREITFRAAGEGTGKAIDLDRFDDHYLHLFLWHAQKREIVGAYRLCPVGSGDLYTNTLFRYGNDFLRKLGPALELGRSFIRPEYQRGFAPLLTLWKGIAISNAVWPCVDQQFLPSRFSRADGHLPGAPCFACCLDESGREPESLPQASTGAAQPHRSGGSLHSDR